MNSEHYLRNSVLLLKEVYTYLPKDVMTSGSFGDINLQNFHILSKMLKAP